MNLLSIWDLESVNRAKVTSFFTVETQDRGTEIGNHSVVRGDSLLRSRIDDLPDSLETSYPTISLCPRSIKS